MSNTHISNEELLNKYEKAGIEYFKLTKEIFIRKMNKELSNEEFDKVGEISLKGASIVLDTIPSDKMNKSIIQKGMIDGLDKIMDENR